MNFCTAVGSFRWSSNRPPMFGSSESQMHITPHYRKEVWVNDIHVTQFDDVHRRYTNSYTFMCLMTMHIPPSLFVKTFTAEVIRDNKQYNIL